MILTAVLLPEPLGPISPTISPCATLRSRPSTARTPPKWRATLFSSSTPPPKQPMRPQVHRQDDERAEEEVAPVAEIAQSLDQQYLDEDHRCQGAKNIGEAADDRVGERKGRDEHVEIAVLDVRRVVRIDAAAEAGDGAADGHGAHFDRR